MSSKAFADRLARALEGTGLVQAVDTNYGEHNIRVLLRVLKDQEPRWIELIRRMLLSARAEHEQAHAFQLHICRTYFLKEIDGQQRLVFGWNVSMQAGEMQISLDFLIPVIKGEEPGKRSNPGGETMEMEFSGPVSTRIPNPRGKGGYTVGGSNDFKVTR